MLKRLAVKSFAIIEDLSIDFSSNMTVLTGQTGAGKSLIIDTISLLLGSRADNDMIRYGDDKAIVLGEFTYTNEKIDIILKEYEIPRNDNLVIKREISTNGKNTIRINNVLVNLQTLKNIAILLADIHVQYDTYRLINQETYLSFIDPIDDDEFNSISNKYLLGLSKYHSLLKKYQEILKGKKTGEEKLEYLLFQQLELKSIKMLPDEDIQLEEKINMLSNYDKIFTNLNECYSNLENEYFSSDNIYAACENLRKISTYESSFLTDCEKLSECYYALEEIKHNVKHSLDSLDFDEAELNYLNERANDINNLKKKYKMSVNEMLNYLEKITLDISMVTNYDEVLAGALIDVEVAYKVLVKEACSLSNYRRKIALNIEKEIISECKDLDLPSTNFKISFNDVTLNNCLESAVFTPCGIDVVDFLISLNKGEPLKSLHKTASGGEMSRIMLAFKVYFSKNTHLSLMVFDEIDTGVSGTTAVKIAEKMHSISQNIQVLCITHLPQVAAIGDHHLFIYKEDANGRTKTGIDYLDMDGRIAEVAKMLSGNKISKFALDHAKELIENK